MKARMLVLCALLACGEDEASPEAIPLVDWVDDLVDHHTNDEAAPDTVDDKHIADDQDSSHFQKRF